MECLDLAFRPWGPISKVGRCLSLAGGITDSCHLEQDFCKVGSSVKRGTSQLPPEQTLVQLARQPLPLILPDEAGLMERHWFPRLGGANLGRLLAQYSASKTPRVSATTCSIVPWNRDAKPAGRLHKCGGRLLTRVACTTYWAKSSAGKFADRPGNGKRRGVISGAASRQPTRGL